MKYYYFIRTLKIDQDKRYFLRKSFHKSQVKFENMKTKTKVAK